VQDDPDQQAIAERMLDAPFIVLPTVVLETIWVLSTRLRLNPGDVADRMQTILGHENADIVSGEAVFWALNAYRNGADFADALHIGLASDAEASSFATFDRAIGRIEGSPVMVEILAVAG